MAGCESSTTTGSSSDRGSGAPSPRFAWLKRATRVAVLECGKRFADKDFPKSTWDLRRYFWAPRLGLRGIFRLTPFKDVSVVSGCGVGGGSLGYANTLYVPPSPFFQDPQWGDLEDWEATLAPHYAEAQRMLGVVEHPDDDPADELLREFGEQIGVGDTYRKTPVGIFFDEPGKTVADPYFGGEGPGPHGLHAVRPLHGRLPARGQEHAGQELPLAGRAPRRHRHPRPHRDRDPPARRRRRQRGLRGHQRALGLLGGRGRRTLTARGVIVAAGPLGTNQLLQRCRLGGSLPRISYRLGELVRTNSEMILAVTVPEDYPDDLTKRIAISASIYPDPHTHIETVTYGKAGDSMNLLYTLMVGDGTRVTRPLKLLAQIVRHPGRFAKTLWPRDWSRRTIILLVMQTLDNAIALRPKLKRSGDVRLQTEQDPEKPNPTFIPVANDAAEWLAQRTGGIAQSSTTEALMNVPTTAHILGGAVIGHGPEDGVVDARQRVFGYENLLVCDGAAVPANVGVNPSLTITALAEHAMAEIPPKTGPSRATARGGAPGPCRLLSSAKRSAT